MEGTGRGEETGEPEMSGHTPGPWAVCTNPANESWWPGTTIGTDHEDDKYSRRICDLAVISPDKEANGRLIASAPDLLEALKRGLSELRTAQRFYEQAGEPTLAGMAAVAVQIGEEVIGRAEGTGGSG